MNKKITMPELVELLAQRQNCTKREAENFVRELLAIMTETISSGEVLRISGLGVFKPVWVEERASVNVQSGERSIIPGHYKLTFTPAKAVREAVNEPFACFCVEELPDNAPIVSESSDIDEMGDNNTEEEIEVAVVEELSAEPPLVKPVETEQLHITPDSLQTEPNEEQEIAHSTEETEIVPVEDAQVIPETKIEEDVVVEDTTPSVTAEEPATQEADKEKNTSKAYLKGVWIGVVATVIVFVAAIALLLVCVPTFRNYLLHNSGHSDSLLVDKSSQVIEEVVVEECDTVETIAIDSVVPVTIEQPVVPVVVDTIRRGVFLTNMSYKHYGHKAFWVYIYEENSNIIANPDNVPVGTVIVIPPAQKYGIDVNDTTAINVALEKAAVIKQRMRK